MLANPDLVRRLQLDSPLNPANQSSSYGGTPSGYVDYPTLDPAGPSASRPPAP